MSNRRSACFVGLTACLLLTGQPGPGRADEDASKKIYPQTLHGTVWIRWSDARFEHGGSGWLADRERKLVVTCYHVVAGADTVQVYFPVYKDDQPIADRAYYLEKGRPVLGRVLETDSKRDLAVIELPSLPLEATELTLAAKSPATASTVHTVGNPGLTVVAPGATPDPLWKYTRGEVSAVYRKKETREDGQAVDALIVQTTQPINRGDSGGPVVNESGELVAVTSAARFKDNLISYAIDVTEVKAFLGDALTFYHPTAAADFKKRGQHYFSQRRFDAAIEDFTAVLRLDPKDAAVYRNRADAFREKLALEKAIVDYVQVLRLDPKDRDAFRERGVCYAALKQYDQAVEDLDQALQIAPDDLRARLFRANSLREKGEIERAMKDYDDLLRDAPANPTFHYERGLAFVALLNFDKAIEDLEKTVELAPRAPDAAFALGEAYFKKGDTDKAVKSYAAAVKLNPQYLDALVRLGAVHYKIEAYDDAVADFDAALKLKENAPAHAGRGKAYRRQRKLDKALDDLNEALWLDPKDAESCWERAGVCLDKGAIDQAVADATEAIRLNPPDAHLLSEAYNTRGVSYYRKGQADKAIADYTKAIGYDAKTPIYYSNRAVGEFDKGAFDQTVADCTRAIDLNPTFAFAYAQRSRAYAKLGMEGESKKDYEKAVEIDPKLKK